MAPAKQKTAGKAEAEASSSGSLAFGILAVAAAAAAGFWWWQRRQKGDGGAGSGKAAGRSSFKVPQAKEHAAGSGSLPRNKAGNNKKNKARRKEEKARRAEKRDRPAEAQEQQAKADGSGEAPSSTTVINYTYFDSSRKDSLLPAAKKRPGLTAADAVKLQQDAAAAAPAAPK